MITEFRIAPRDAWLPFLLDGWRLPFVVEPMIEHHGRHSILLSRPAA